MTRARNLSDLLDSNGDVKSGALDNVPASDVVNDTTPQLGGNLDLNSNDITGTGNIDVTGTVTADGLKVDDNAYIKVGTGDDLWLYHNGSNSHIEDRGTGDLVLKSNNNMWFQDYGTNEVMLKLDSGGAVNAYYDNSKKLATTSTGVSVIGTIAADTLTHSTAGSLTTDYVVNGSAKQWSYVNDTGASAIIDSFNTTSWTDNGTGNGTVNIASDMSNATYNISVSTNADNGGKNRACGLFTGTNGTTSTSGLYRISRWISTANSLEDGYFYSSTLGDLA